MLLCQVQLVVEHIVMIPVTRTTTWTGYVGLPYVSDYGYATDESLCLNTEYVGWNNTTGYYPHAYCHTNDWMWKSSSFYWTIMPDSSDAYSVWMCILAAVRTITVRTVRTGLLRSYI
jgi:hypothetical protein